MCPGALRRTVALIAVGAFLFAPASERVQSVVRNARSDISMLVLLPTVDDGIGADGEQRRVQPPADLSAVVAADLEALHFGLAALYVVLVIGAVPARAARHASQWRRAPPALGTA